MSIYPSQNNRYSLKSKLNLLKYDHIYLYVVESHSQAVQPRRRSFLLRSSQHQKLDKGFPSITNISSVSFLETKTGYSNFNREKLIFFIILIIIIIIEVLTILNNKKSILNR